MGDKRVRDKEELKHRLYTRVNDAKYAELCKLVDGKARQNMSGLLRDILYNRTIKVFTKDKTMDATIEELAQLRSEVRAIGVNINQITRWFNTFPDPPRKFAQAKIAFDSYLLLNDKIERLLKIMSNLGKKWLQE